MKRPLIICVTLFTVACVAFVSVRAYLDWQLPRATATLQIVFPTISSGEEIGKIHTGPNSPISILNESIELALASPEVKQAAQNANLAQDRLHDLTTIEPVPNTDFIEIITRHESRSHAVALANAFADAAVRIQNERNQSRAQERLQALKENVTKQEEDLRLKDQNIRTLIAEYSLPTPEIGAPFPDPDSIPKHADEKPGNYSSRQKTYRETLKAFHHSRESLLLLSDQFPKASSTIRHHNISLMVRNYAQ